MLQISGLVKVRTTLQIRLIVGTTKLAETLLTLGEQVKSRLTDPEGAAKYFQNNCAALIGPAAIEAMIGEPSSVLSTFDKLVDDLQQSGRAEYMVDGTQAAGNFTKTSGQVTLDDLAGSAKIIVDALKTLNVKVAVAGYFGPRVQLLLSV